MLSRHEWIAIAKQSLKHGAILGCFLAVFIFAPYLFMMGLSHMTIPFFLVMSPLYALCIGGVIWAYGPTGRGRLEYALLISLIVLVPFPRVLFYLADFSHGVRDSLVIYLTLFLWQNLMWSLVVGLVAAGFAEAFSTIEGGLRGKR